MQAMAIKMNSDVDVMLEEDQDSIQCKWVNMSSQMMYNGESIHVNDQNEHGKNQDHYAKQCKIIDQYNQHINVSNEYGNEA